MSKRYVSIGSINQIPVDILSIHSDSYDTTMNDIDRLENAVQYHKPTVSVSKRVIEMPVSKETKSKLNEIKSKYMIEKKGE